MVLGADASLRSNDVEEGIEVGREHNLNASVSRFVVHINGMVFAASCSG